MTGPSWRDLLSKRQMVGILAVLEAAEDGGGGSAFKERIVDAISTHFGVRDVTFFHGATYREIFADPAPLLTGATEPLLDVYQEEWHEKDIFATPQARRLLTGAGFTTLEQLASLPVPQRSYVVDYLHPNGMETAAALHLPLADGEALVGMFDRELCWNESDFAAIRVLTRQLRARSVLIRGADIAREEDVLARLTPRQHEVADLVSDGFSNHEIAMELSLSEQSVKTYISRIFEVTGHRNRAELATAVLRRHANGH